MFIWPFFAGGIVIVAIELSGLREYVRINPQVRNLDTLYTFLVESEIIPSELNERCEGLSESPPTAL